jgi:hypothetical protein
VRGGVFRPHRQARGRGEGGKGRGCLPGGWQGQCAGAASSMTGGSRPKRPSPGPPKPQTPRFNQAWWAEQLLAVLRSHDGALATRAEAHAALTDLVGRLGDRWGPGRARQGGPGRAGQAGRAGQGGRRETRRMPRHLAPPAVPAPNLLPRTSRPPPRYSAFLEPSDFRRALRRPLPQERSYLAAQFVGGWPFRSGPPGCRARAGRVAWGLGSWPQPWLHSSARPAPGPTCGC